MRQPREKGGTGRDHLVGKKNRLFFPVNEARVSLGHPIADETRKKKTHGTWRQKESAWTKLKGYVIYSLAEGCEWKGWDGFGKGVETVPGNNEEKGPWVGKTVSTGNGKFLKRMGPEWGKEYFRWFPYRLPPVGNEAQSNFSEMKLGQ